MEQQRAAGILLHPTSLPGRFGIGDLGAAAFKFCDLLAEAGQSYWQILPLGPTGYGDSPYQCFSAFAGNTLLISPEKLAADGLIERAMLDEAPQFDEKRVDYGAVYQWKSALLPKAFERFRVKASVDQVEKFQAFITENDFWLNDYAMFRSIKAEQDQRPWYQWPESIRLRETTALEAAAGSLTDNILAEKFYQCLFFSQWQAVKQYANDLGIKIMGDIPIFVAHDSSDVWCNQDKFRLNADGTAKYVAGVPPDYFSKTGQLWGNPIYDWDAMRRDGFGWWAARVHSMLSTVDVIRIDHFRGFVASWEVPGGDNTAVNGNWVDVPGRELFETLRNNLGVLPMIAEDLGDITPEVKALLEETGFPGMRILQFAFGGDANNHDLPHNYIKNCVAYTGTHDNDTAVGWYSSQAGAGATRSAKEISRVQKHCLTYLNSDSTEINWDFVRAIWASVANTAIAPVQDLLGLDSAGRMNLPASTSGNWNWRMTEGQLADDIISRLKDITETYGRSPSLNKI